MQQSFTKSVTLVLGGVRSGKSRYAQQLAQRVDRVTFVATAEHRDDPEMRVKIDRHRADRPATWTTIEEPLHLSAAIRDAGNASDAVLIDCMTLFAANLLEAYDGNEVGLELEISRFCETLKTPSCSIILVSNEVGSGVVPAYESGRKFRDLVGEINQRVAAIADNVLLMVAGLPLVIKGSIPTEMAQ